jgi:hypothetical protein
MSTSPDTENRLVSLLSRWLARDVPNDELLRQVEAVGTEGLSEEQAGAVEELVVELRAAGRFGRGDLEMVVRETLEALALG